MAGNKKGLIILIVVLIIAIITAGVLLVMKIVKDKNKGEENTVISLGVENIKEKQKEPQINIFSGTDRPIAVMIDNHKDAWPQASINDAYMVYEIIAEGGESRLMALYKGKNLEKIGPIRSSRHYFLDYALENNAIYVHYGWSPKAQSDISTLKVNNINGITEASGKTGFWRVKDKAAPHNAVTSTENILKMATQKGYKTTSEEKCVLNYVEENVELDSDIIATNIQIPYSTLHTVQYKYNEETKLYERYARGKRQTDWDTKKGIDTKNIIITFAKNTDLQDGENKDRQNLSNVGNLDGYYITNGKAIKIKCEKASRTSKTIYKDLSGNIININDGNTFVQICPIDADVTFE